MILVHSQLAHYLGKLRLGCHFPRDSWTLRACLSTKRCPSSPEKLDFLCHWNQYNTASACLEQRNTTLQYYHTCRHSRISYLELMMQMGCTYVTSDLCFALSISQNSPLKRLLAMAPHGAMGSPSFLRYGSHSLLGSCKIQAVLNWRERHWWKVERFHGHLNPLRTIPSKKTHLHLTGCHPWTSHNVCGSDRS